MNSREAKTLESLRDRFVFKYEGYRAQTAQEQEDGVYPDNFSAVPLGRGHGDRMTYRPFPEPTPPGVRLDRNKYNALIAALLYDYSVVPPKRPLVEYYKYNDENGDLQPWTVSKILADIEASSGFKTCWARGGNYRQYADDEVVSFIEAILDRLSPVLWKYEKCEPEEYPLYAWKYEECTA